jgi:hypothetical protein
MGEVVPAIYTIYNHPYDYPDEFVCRVWHGMTPERNLFARGKTLEEVRKQIPAGAVNIGRMTRDDSKIAECWIL